MVDYNGDSSLRADSLDSALFAQTCILPLVPKEKTRYLLEENFENM